jgi:hypothetical protein
MDGNEFLKLFYTKAKDLYNYAGNVKNSRQDIANEIQKLIDLCISDDSIQQMRCFQAFFTYAFSYVGEQYTKEGGKPDRNAFIDDLKIKTGHCTKRTQKTVVEGCTLQIITYIPKSISFSECSQKKRTEFFNNAKDIIEDEIRGCVDINGKKKKIISFDSWFNHWQGYENTI